jgi:hypothetical protein
MTAVSVRAQASAEQDLLIANHEHADALLLFGRRDCVIDADRSTTE